MTWNDVIACAARYPGVEEGVCYGAPALRVRGKLLTRLRIEDDSITLHDVPVDEREMLIEMDPTLFHTTPHYTGSPIVLARLSALTPGRLEPFLERRWRRLAGRALVRQFEGAAWEWRTSSPPLTPPASRPSSGGRRGRRG